MFAHARKFLRICRRASLAFVFADLGAPQRSSRVVVIVPPPLEIGAIAPHEHVLIRLVDLAEVICHAVAGHERDAVLARLIPDSLEQEDRVIHLPLVLDEPLDKEGVHSHERCPIDLHHLDGVGDVLPFRGVRKGPDRTMVKLIEAHFVELTHAVI